MVTQTRLKERIHYNPTTGIFTWRDGSCKGKEAGSKSKYVYIVVDGIKHGAHQWAFLYMPGYIPKLIDHRDNDTYNNAWKNIRAATSALNNVNRGKSKNNKAGIKNICWDKHNKNWKAQVMIQGRIHTKSNKNKQKVLAWLAEQQKLQLQIAESEV